MSWIEVKKINSNLKRPLNEGGIIKGLYVPNPFTITSSALVPSQEVELYSCTMDDTKELVECVFYRLPAVSLTTSTIKASSNYYPILLQGYVIYRIYLDDEVVLMCGTNWAHKSYTEGDIADWDNPNKYSTYNYTNENEVNFLYASENFDGYVSMYIVNENHLKYSTGSSSVLNIGYTIKRQALNGSIDSAASFQGDFCEIDNTSLSGGRNVTHPCQFYHAPLYSSSTSFPSISNSIGLLVTKDYLPFKKLTLTAEFRCPVIDSSSRRVAGNWNYSHGNISYVD